MSREFGPEELPEPARVGEPVQDAYSRAVGAVTDTVLPAVAGVATRRSAGSAVVCTDDGHLLTSAHLIGPAESTDVRFADGTVAVADVVGSDPLSDIAVLRARGGGPAPARLGDADALTLGRLVVALADPAGPGGAVSAGVVGAVDRAVPVLSRRAGRLVEQVLHTDVRCEPHAAGGPLADTAGRVIGVLTAAAGIGGLAVPIGAVARRVLDTLLADGLVRRAYLGVVVAAAPVPPELRQVAGQAAGARVTAVVRGGPADRAGLQRGDLLLCAGETVLTGARELQRLLFAEAIEVTLAVTLLRAGAPVTVDVTPPEWLPA
ncbi:S1C family serine protease [Nocardia asteroides]|uniref:S1C family serine protease n=1 Tax=Nocardia asteroides TaxID=1824 RepID=UPI001E319B7F|nr:S1C family serine protease [Nocardia asteroides]UGT61551.1 S1C family serine protease [Nocardia asteroides]